MQPLPIDECLPAILDALAEPRASGSLVLEAPPGAGKTTRVPYALSRAAWCRGQILVTEPRRIAARLSATRVAQERGLTLGQEVGYRVRFDDRTGPTTRLVYLTEGLLLRRLSSDQDLEGVDAIVFDEVHEQSADLEIALGLITRLQERRQALRLVAMSATLDAERIARFWNDAPRITSAGRSYEIQVEHAPTSDTRPLPVQVRSAVRAALSRPGHVLVFLPGAREIRACEEALAGHFDVELVPLHGDLPIEDQARAIQDSGATRRVVLSTNVAESSLTIPGVTTVIDSGLGRVARHDPWSGIQRLELEEISQARAVQRAGRAGRTCPGVAVRLYTKSNFNARPPQETPELARSNLSEILLLLRAAGVDESELPLLTALPTRSWQQAEIELEALGAIDASGVTIVGKRMLSYPLPVRLARVLVEADDLGLFDDGALATALLADRDIVAGSRGFGARGSGRVEVGDSDLEDRMFRYREAARARFSGSSLRALELDPAGVRRVERAYGQLRKRAPVSDSPVRAGGEGLTRALLAGFWDRVAERRGSSHELLLMNGSTARLSESSAVMRAPFLLCLSADAPRGKQAGAIVRLAHRIDADLLLDAAGKRIEAREEFQWSTEKERVEEISALTYGRITLDSSVSNARPSPGAGAALFKVARAKGASSFDPDARLETLSARLLVLSEYAPEIFLSLENSAPGTELDWIDPTALAERALNLACRDATRWSELLAVDLGDLMAQHLPPELTRALREWVPSEVTLTGGLRVPVHYQAGRTPWIEARLQNFFGMERAPTLCRGRAPLQIHLLAPNKRAVQVTTDLASFWEKHYPTLRRELMRRYPKHLWPEDGRHAAPPTPGKIR